jgi:hypothetical protein
MSVSGNTKLPLTLNCQNLSNATTESLRLTGGIIPLAGSLKPQSEQALPCAFQFQRELLGGHFD